MGFCCCIVNYCKLHKLKLVKITKNGFIASKTIKVKAGMPFNTPFVGLFDVAIKTILNDFIYIIFIHCLYETNISLLY